MRWSRVACLLLFLPVAVSGQADGPLASDGSGDVASQGVPGVPPLTLEGAVDLLSLHVEEVPTGFTMRIGVADLSSSGAPGELQTAYAIEFGHGGSSFQAIVYRYALMGTPASYSAYLNGYDQGRGAYRLIEEVDVAIDGDTISVMIPRSLLRDGSGAAPSPGRLLEDFVVTSAGNNIGSICIVECVPFVHWGDRMPDSGFAPGVHEVVYGVEQTGSARLASKEPFRASNGEATTFVFQVDAANVGDEEDVFRFDASGAPEHWDVQVPAESVRLGPKTNTTVPVIVRTPFAHAHGSATSFILELQSVRDPNSIGRLEMGVFYPSPPQPAGHHDTLWLHTVDLSADPANVAMAAAFGMLGVQGLLQSEYMNTLEEDERADEVPSEGQYCRLHALDPDYPVGSGYCWEFPLDPGLLMGLDFDVTRTGTLELSVGSQLPLPGASVEGRLLHLGAPTGNYPPGYPVQLMQREELVLATINRSAMQDIGAMGSASFELEFHVSPEADRVPYQAGVAMVLELQVNTLRPENFYIGPKLPPPTLAGGARLQLPLNEYEDEVKQLVEFGGTVVLDSVSELQRRVNPGRTVVFEAMLRNEGDEESSFRLNLIGSNREWSSMLGPETIRLAPGAHHKVSIAVSPPEGTSPGDRADLVLEAASQDDINERALLRFLAIVVTDEDIPDEAALANSLSNTPAKQSPGPLWLLAVGAAALLARRRH